MALPDWKPFSRGLAYSCNIKFSQNLPNRTKFYGTCPSFLRISESLWQSTYYKRCCKGIFKSEHYRHHWVVIKTHSRQKKLLPLLWGTLTQQSISEILIIFKGAAFFCPFHRCSCWCTAIIHLHIFHIILKMEIYQVWEVDILGF